MLEARLHDGSSIAVEVHGHGPSLLVPINPQPVEGPQAEEMRHWGADPALGRTMIDGLSDAFQVVAFDYEGHVPQVPKPDTLTPDNVANDLLAVADTVGVDRFAYYGYSWLALVGLQLAIRSDRLRALAMGGFPPLDGPYAEMLQVTTATHEMAVASTASPPSTATPAQPSEEPSAEPSDDPDWSQMSSRSPRRRRASSSRSTRRCGGSTTVRCSRTSGPSPVLRRLGGRDRLRGAVGRCAREPRGPGDRSTFRARGDGVAGSRLGRAGPHAGDASVECALDLRPWLLDALGNA